MQAETSDLRELAEEAGENYRTFWRGADFAGVDLRGQDLRDFDLGEASLKGALIDEATRLPRGKSAPKLISDSVIGSRERPTALKPSGFSHRIAPHIPYLRRYARSVSGSQAAGDAYVAAVLEALIADPSLLDTKEEARLSLYKLFSGLWQAVDVKIREDPPASFPESNASRALRAIAPLSRQAFLLVAVEGFTAAEAARILGLDEREFSRLIDQASSDIGREVSTDIMIIEDEPLIAMDIERIVESLGHTVTGVARTHKEAISLSGRQKPGMILADIQLADGSSGIDAVNEILAEISVPVIFITAFPERLLTSKRPEPSFLITKPFSLGILKAIITQAAMFDPALQR